MALTGLKVIEFAGLAPGPFAGLVLADNGASVIRIDRISSESVDVLCRGKRSLAVNTKTVSGRELLKKLIADADVLIDPFRPGVMERLQLGPNVFLGEKGLNEKLIYARVVGFPRTGPHSNMAGHDINYLATSGVLSMLPGPGKPRYPLNILADFAGGGMMCAFGILLALAERSKTGKGQVVDTDMVSGVRYLSTFSLMHNLYGSPNMSGDREQHQLGGGVPFYDVYCCKGGGWMSVGCLEPQFFREFLEIFRKSLPRDFSVDNGWTPIPEMQGKPYEYSKLREYVARGFMTNTRDYWAKAFHGTDACAVPVLTPSEAADAHPSRSDLPVPHPDVSGSARIGLVSESFVLAPGTHTEEILRDMGLKNDELERLISEGAIELRVRPKL